MKGDFRCARADMYVVCVWTTGRLIVLRLSVFLVGFYFLGVIVSLPSVCVFVCQFLFFRCGSVDFFAESVLCLCVFCKTGDVVDTFRSKRERERRSLVNIAVAGSAHCCLVSAPRIRSCTDVSATFRGFGSGQWMFLCLCW